MLAAGNKMMRKWFSGMVLVLLLLSGGGLIAGEKWRTLKRCTLIANPANDADSFHVRHGKKEYFVRLLFVDAPETDMRFPERVREQAEWFGTTPEVALHYGKVATDYTAACLQKPFTLYTQFVDARGGSREKRIFAMVKTGDRYLCEQLVEQGLVRIYGFRRDLPDGTSDRRFSQRLEALEKDAKMKKAGLWSGRKDPI